MGHFEKLVLDKLELGTLSRTELEALWTTYDKDKSGDLDKSEIKSLLQDIHQAQFEKFVKATDEILCAAITPGNPLCWYQLFLSYVNGQNINILCISLETYLD